MKNTQQLIKANWENLTSLWKTAGNPFQANFEGPIFDYCEINHSEWPNRLWFHEDITQNDVELALQKIKTSRTRLTIPYRDIYDSKSYEILETNGFTKAFEQVGMSLRLTKPLSLDNNLEVRLISNPSEIKIWTGIYPLAFGYHISEEILLRTFNHINYYLAFEEGRPAGTAIVFHSGPIAGIHGVGVIPEMRRKGYAEAIMKHVLNQSMVSGAKYATLQASEMGKGLYLKLGFEEQFGIKNYRLRSDIL